MIIDAIRELGAWSWIIVGLLLLIGELLLPGIFLIWFGISALIVGALALVSFMPLLFPWQMQIVLFAVLSLFLILVWLRYFPSRRDDDAAGGINNPLSRYIGTETSLIEPIENGAGRVKLGDTTWRVTGAELPAGSRVRIVGTKDNTMVVEAVR